MEPNGRSTAHAQTIQLSMRRAEEAARDPSYCRRVQAPGPEILTATSDVRIHLRERLLACGAENHIRAGRGLPCQRDPAAIAPDR